jgi:malate synthase
VRGVRSHSAIDSFSPRVRKERAMSPTTPPRVRFAPVEGADQLFTPAFDDYLALLHDRFDARVRELLAAREATLRRALAGQRPGPLPPSAATTGDWKVPPVPDDLKKPGIEISGPCSITSMFINALNPGPEGERAEGDLDDDEDSGGHRLVDTVRAALNRVAAVQRELAFTDTARKRDYKIAEGELPFFMHRERGIHLYEPDVTVDGRPVNAALLGTALTLYYAGRAQAERGQGIYFYLPKLEAAAEARLYRDVFDASRAHLPHLADATIRAIVLVESLPCVYQMEEMLYELGPFAAGLNAARWDLKASIFEFVMTDPASVWPDRFGVDIKTTPFIGDIFRRLVAICLKRGAVPIGGMATALPSQDPEVNRVAAEAIRADKEWEAKQGFLRGWVAHIFHMKTAADPFRQLIGSGFKPAAAMANPDNYPVRIDVPQGPITLEGTRRNARMVVEYVEGWLNGRGAKGIDSLAGKSGIHPALMEDLATGRMSVAQLAQRIRHHAKTTDGPAATHDAALVKRVLHDETEDILRGVPDEDAKARYRKAGKIALRWIKNYTDLDFRSLGSYTRADLDRIASEPEAF